MLQNVLKYKGKYKWFYRKNGKHLNLIEDICTKKTKLNKKLN